MGTGRGNGPEENGPFGGRGQTGAHKIWSVVIDNATDEVPADAMSNWIAPLRLVAEIDNSILISAQDAYTLDRAQNEFGKLLQTYWNQQDSRRRRLKFEPWTRIDRAIKSIVDNPWREAEPDAAETNEARECRGASARSPHEADDVRHTCCRRVQPKGRADGARDRRRRTIHASIVVLYGKPGTGKTHILQGIMHEADRRGDTRRITYMSAEEFMTRFVNGAGRATRQTCSLWSRTPTFSSLMICTGSPARRKQAPPSMPRYARSLRLAGRSSSPQMQPRVIWSGYPNSWAEELRGCGAVEVGDPDPEMRKEIVRRRAALIEERLPSFILTEGMVDLIVTGIHGPGGSFVVSCPALRSRQILARWPQLPR